MLDIVTLFWYHLGTVKNCESGASPAPDGPVTSSETWQVARPACFSGEGTMAGKGRPRRPLVLTGASKPQLRKRAPRDWSKAKARAFLSALADTCNVTQACRDSGVPSAVVYRRRKRDAAFRAGWLEALSTAYQRLELVLLERAFVGTEKLVRRKDGVEERMIEYSNQLGLALLKMHRDTATEAAPDNAPDNIEEIRERLFNKLERLRKREEARAKGSE
jgi:hypothetical protein